jgi:D-alanyl-D-alanine dipeptidase
MKPHYQVPIVECGEPLVPIPVDRFARISPHPYEQLGAPYGRQSPFYLRQGVCDRLILAQNRLQQQRPGWRIQIFDAYRPIAVQQFMVDYTLRQLVQSRGLHLDRLTDTQQQALLEQVYQFWAPPSNDPATPPPHSTGAAIDLTLLDANGQVIDMGSAIDELSPRSYPQHFAHSDNPSEGFYHQHRQLLYDCMATAGFTRHPNEWWHFSFGDQMWAWLRHRVQPEVLVVAQYGRWEGMGDGG